MNPSRRRKVREFRAVFRRFERVQKTLMEDRDCCSGLTTAQCHPLLEIDEVRQTNLRELAAKLNLDPSTLSRTIDNLVQRGLVRREANPEDRRYVLLSLTDDGQKICDRINEQNDRFYDDILRRMADQKRGVQLFDDLVRSLVEAVSPTEDCSCEERE